MRQSRLNRAVSSWHRQRVARISLHVEQSLASKPAAKGFKDLPRPPTTSNIFQILQYEEENGFVNCKGQSDDFHVAVFKELQRLREHCPWNLKRELDALNTKYQEYPAWDTSRRKQHVEATKAVMSQTMWVREDLQRMQGALPQQPLQASYRQRQNLSRLGALSNSRPSNPSRSVRSPSESTTSDQNRTDSGTKSAVPRSSQPLAQGASNGRNIPLQAAEQLHSADRGVNGAIEPSPPGEQKLDVHELQQEPPRQSGLFPWQSSPSSDQPLPGGKFIAGVEKMSFGELCLSKKYKLIAYDTETNGELDQRIIELAAYAVESGQKFHTLVNCGREVLPKVVELHGIRTEDISRPHVPTFREAGQEFINFAQQQLGDDPEAAVVLVAHNLKGFDHIWMTHEFQLVSPDWQWPDGWLYFDTYTFARGLYGYGQQCSQKALLERFGLPRNLYAHRALPDVMSLSRVMQALLNDSKMYTSLDHFLSSDSPERSKSWGSLQELSTDKSPGQIKTARSKSPASPAKKAVTVKRATPRPRDPSRKQESIPDELIRAFPEDWANRLSQELPERPLLDLSLSVNKSPLTPTQRTRLRENGFTTIGEVLECFPRLHRDCQLKMVDEEYATLVGTIVKHNSFTRGQMSKMSLEFEVDPAHLAGLKGVPAPSDVTPQRVHYKKISMGRFNGAASAVSKFALGDSVIAQGKLSQSRGVWNLDADMIAPLEEGAPLPPLIVPHYSKRTTATPDMCKKAVDRALKEAQKDAYKAKDWDCLPAEVLQDQELPLWQDAIQQIHYPESLQELEAARRHFVFTELYLWQLNLILWGKFRREAARNAETPAPRIIDHNLVGQGLQALPYKLTKGQLQSLHGILEDMKGPIPLDGLLQGDVACGKTIVAFLAMLAAAGSGFQTALMAPSQILAEQHHQGLQKLLEGLPDDVRPTLALLTSDTKQADRKKLSAALAEGELQMLVGTHALLWEKEPFKNLGLAVIDEQHKFGVSQRAALQDKASPVPHLLCLGATPIPRTLELMQTGHLTSYAIKELPPGRQSVVTLILPDTPLDVGKMCEDIKGDIASGGRAYFIFPRIESRATANLKTVKSEHPLYVESQVLGEDVVIEMIHGQLSASEQNERARRFKAGETHVLFATSLVEVGLDVPEASTIVVYNANNFGLAQLHQFRGRVGRGTRPSKCYLLYPEDDSAAEDRLALLKREQDGFRIAEADLELRGAGNLLGSRQSGDVLADIPLYDAHQDRAVLEQARVSASATIDRYGLSPNKWPAPLLDALARKVAAGLKANQA